MNGMFFNKMSLTLLVSLCFVLPASASRPQPKGLLKSVAHSPVETLISRQGKRYVVSNGRVYELMKNGKRELRDTLFDGEFINKNYKTDGQAIFHSASGSGKNYAVFQDFQDGFESANTIQDLIGPEKQWHSMTLLSPAAPGIEEYVKLRNKIIYQGARFKDNTISISQEQVRSGKKSLKFYAVKPSGSMEITKTSLDNELLFLKRGDHVSMTGWFYIAQGAPTSLMDLECNYMNQSPGMRLMLSEDLVPRIELKWADKPTYRVLRGSNARLVRNQWVKLSMYLYLSENADGRVRLLMNDKVIIEGHGQNLPIADAVYNRLELGITSNPRNSQAVLYVDDVSMGRYK